MSDMPRGYNDVAGGDFRTILFGVADRSGTGACIAADQIT
jgi:hypothetical protein